MLWSRLSLVTNFRRIPSKVWRCFALLPIWAWTCCVPPTSTSCFLQSTASQVVLPFLSLFILPLTSLIHSFLHSVRIAIMNMDISSNYSLLSISFPSTPRPHTLDEWKDALNGMKQLYIQRQYKQCQVRSMELLAAAMEPVRAFELYTTRHLPNIPCSPDEPCPQDLSPFLHRTLVRVSGSGGPCLLQQQSIPVAPVARSLHLMQCRFTRPHSAVESRRET